MANQYPTGPEFDVDTADYYFLRVHAGKRYAVECTGTWAGQTLAIGTWRDGIPGYLYREPSADDAFEFTATVNCVAFLATGPGINLHVACHPIYP